MTIVTTRFLVGPIIHKVNGRIVSASLCVSTATAALVCVVCAR
jgi:hypothetical protein